MGTQSNPRRALKSAQEQDDRRRRRNERDRGRCAAETAEQRSERLRKRKERDRARRAAQSVSKRQAASQQKSTRERERMAAETPDGISGHMLRNTTISIYPALTRIFNISLPQQKFPLAWKTSNVNPIPKSSDLSHYSNYRPISLLSLPSKILERIVHNCVSKFLSKHNLLSRSQSSTQEALLSVTNTWQTMLSKHI